LLCNTNPNANPNPNPNANPNPNLTQDVTDKNSSGDEIANVNFFYNIAHAEASAYAH